LIAAELNWRNPAIKVSLQPFHAAAELSLAAAEQLIRKQADSTNTLALRSLHQLMNDLYQQGYQATVHLQNL